MRRETVPLKRGETACKTGLAETARFELAVAVTRYDGLANRWFQPLTHVSSEATILWL